MVKRQRTQKVLQDNIQGRLEVFFENVIRDAVRLPRPLRLFIAKDGKKRKSKWVLCHLHLQSVEASPPRHRCLLQGYIWASWTLVNDLFERMYCCRGFQVGPLQQDRGAPSPPGRSKPLPGSSFLVNWPNTPSCRYQSWQRSLLQDHNKLFYPIISLRVSLLRLPSWPITTRSPPSPPSDFRHKKGLF